MLFRSPTPVFLGFPGASAGKESASNVGDLDSIPGLGRSPGEGKSYPLQYFGLGPKELDTTERLLLFTFISIQLYHIFFSIFLMEKGAHKGKSHLWPWCPIILLPLGEEGQELFLLTPHLLVPGGTQQGQARARPTY